jgi:hypothetical protein
VSISGWEGKGYHVPHAAEVMMKAKIVPETLCTMNGIFPGKHPPEKRCMYNLIPEITATYYLPSPPSHRLQARYKYDSDLPPK